MAEEGETLGAEQKKVGGLDWKVYRAYWAAMGGVLTAFIFLSLFLMQGLN